MKTTIGELKNLHRGCGKVRLMFQDEAGFGRINHPKYCWCEKGIRPSVPCHHIREYRYAYGAVEPLTGDSCFLVMPYCNTACMNLFLRELSKQFPQDTILMCCDGAAWHKSGTLEVPENIVLFHIPPYTPEMNPIEQIWKEIKENSSLRNMATIKPLDEALVLAAAKKCDKIITAEEHSVIGGLGEAACSALSKKLPTHVKCIGVNDEFGHSGSASALLKVFGLSSEHILEVAKHF